MDPLDQISRRKQHLSDRLDALDKRRAVLDEHREKVLAEIADCDAAERVLRNISSEAEQPVTPIDRASRLSLTKIVQDSVASHPNGVRQDELRAYIAEKHGEDVKPTSLATTLQRHKAAGRVINRDGVWFPSDKQSASSGGEASEDKLELMLH